MIVVSPCPCATLPGKASDAKTGSAAVDALDDPGRLIEADVQTVRPEILRRRAGRADDADICTGLKIHGSNMRPDQRS
ncbi:hypothetical protein [Brevundimonas sp. TWP2-3-4b2]|uniref:hypothetical protein n=1 Tax=Brevundimonas sp. TWP2-3-4b2 TaxID=2804595 RepID=UPI003CF6267E